MQRFPFPSNFSGVWFTLLILFNFWSIQAIQLYFSQRTYAGLVLTGRRTNSSNNAFHITVALRTMISGSVGFASNTNEDHFAVSRFNGHQQRRDTATMPLCCCLLPEHSRMDKLLVIP